MTEPSELDQGVRELCQRGELQDAATRILEALGPNVVRVIHARFRDDQVTADVFSAFAEDLWLGLPRFRFGCPLRVWVFVLARNAGNRHLKRELYRQRAQLPLSAVPEFERRIGEIRTQTLEALQTPQEQRLSRLRAELTPDEQELITLRIDRELDFAEIALVVLGDVDAQEEEVKREAARLRKRFQLLKERLRKRWQEQEDGG